MTIAGLRRNHHPAFIPLERQAHANQTALHLTIFLKFDEGNIWLMDLKWARRSNSLHLFLTVQFKV